MNITHTWFHCARMEKTKRVGDIVLPGKGWQWILGVALSLLLFLTWAVASAPKHDLPVRGQPGFEEAVKRAQQQQREEQRQQALNFNFLCTKKEKDGRTTDYYESRIYDLGSSLTLRQKVSHVDVRISTIRSSGGWDMNSLCGSGTIDLPEYQWQILIPGTDCGAGAAIEPCDLAFISDESGVTAVMFGPSMNGHVSSTVGTYLREGALIKITGKTVE